MSRYSPDVVQSVEQLSRFIFSPLHINSKDGKPKPNLFSHALKQGCSVQREDRASVPEITTFVAKFLAANTKQSWLGVLIARCDAVRAVRIAGNDKQRACAYDTAEELNPAHAEIFWSHSGLEEGDANELRKLFMDIFDAANPIAPNKYRSGTVLTGVTRTAIEGERQQSHIRS